jgi:hypothetical protein
MLSSGSCFLVRRSWFSSREAAREFFAGVHDLSCVLHLIFSRSFELAAESWEREEIACTINRELQRNGVGYVDTVDWQNDDFADGRWTGSVP